MPAASTVVSMARRDYFDTGRFLPLRVTLTDYSGYTKVRKPAPQPKSTEGIPRRRSGVDEGPGIVLATTRWR